MVRDLLSKEHGSREIKLPLRAKLLNQSILAQRRNIREVTLNESDNLLGIVLNVLYIYCPVKTYP